MVGIVRKHVGGGMLLGQVAVSAASSQTHERIGDEVRCAVTAPDYGHIEHCSGTCTEKVRFAGGDVVSVELCMSEMDGQVARREKPKPKDVVVVVFNRGTLALGLAVSGTVRTIGHRAPPTR
ncbi:hypothetical protein [Rhodococcus sp. APC 3903]|uniref:hypothetical protein n=1 Tax=Rhodococcus sp. APC 3903 TaxID=3035193 RepID=UPI0025B44B7D|nr:hypothetical protein [Rhodococcus sp. APC 3903]MDN3460700.1 hypothetical protein [Rhodococcus sp. APC 3903]